MCNCLLQSVVLLCTLLELVQSRQCGFPGRPRNGTSTSSSVMSRPGDTARYTCQPGFTLFGDEERVCLDSGIWAGRQPICALNLARGHNAMLSATLWNYRAALAVDGKLDTCSYAPRTSEPRWWQVDLLQDYHIASVGVFISKDIYQEFTVFVVQLVSRQARYKPCAIFKGRFQSMKIFHCNEGLGLTGRYIYIRDDRRELNDYFGLCEVEVFSLAERVVCGEPEEPVGGHVTWSPEGPAMYTCDPGLELTAEPNRTCEHDGRWAGHAPQCKAIECYSPSLVLYGYVDLYGRNRGKFYYGSVISYNCRKGYMLWGNATRSCGRTGKWSGHAPHCKPISCSYPPTLSNTEVELVNKSTLWNTIAIYSCKSGYSSSEGTLQAMSTCLNTGMWEEVNISCEMDASLHRLGPLQGTGWSHRSQETDKDLLHENSLGVVGIIIIAALCIIVLLVIVGVTIILARRFKSQNNPQAVKSTTNEMILNNKKDDTYDDVASSGYPMVVATDASKPSTQSKLENTACSVTNHHNLFPQAGEHSNYNTLHSFPSMSSYNSTLATDTDEELNYARIKARKNCEPGYEAIKVQVERVAVYPDYETVHSLQQFIGDPSYEPVHPSHMQERQMRPNHISSRSIHLLPSALKAYTQPNNIIMQPDIGDGNVAGRVPQEILALYAQVDKTKKVRYRDQNDDDNLEDVMEISDTALQDAMLLDESSLNIIPPYESYDIPPAQFANSPERSVSPNSGQPLALVPCVSTVDSSDAMSQQTPMV